MLHLKMGLSNNDKSLVDWCSSADTNLWDFLFSSHVYNIDYSFPLGAKDVFWCLNNEWGNFKIKTFTWPSTSRSNHKKMRLIEQSVRKVRWSCTYYWLSDVSMLSKFGVHTTLCDVWPSEVILRSGGDVRMHTSSCRKPHGVPIDMSRETSPRTRLQKEQEVKRFRIGKGRAVVSITSDIYLTCCKSFLLQKLSYRLGLGTATPLS